MKRERLSKEFIITLFVIAFISLMIGFYFIPQNRYEEFIGSGSSMEPTFSDGDVLLVDSERKYKELDVIVFSCLSCTGVSTEEILTKRIYEIRNDGCLWVVGDNQLESYDSKTFGWLCKEDLKIYGVAISKKDE